MKITDLTITVFNWITLNWSAGANSFGGNWLLGGLTVHTGESLNGEPLEGHAFLGSSRQGADAFAGPIMEFIKPNLLGRDPLDIGAIWAWMWKQNRSVATNGIGAVDVALWDIAG